MSPRKAYNIWARLGFMDIIDDIVKAESGGLTTDQWRTGMRKAIVVVMDKFQR